MNPDGDYQMDCEHNEEYFKHGFTNDELLCELHRVVGKS